MKLRRLAFPSLAAAINRYVAEVSPHKKGGVSERSLARRWLDTRLSGRTVERIRNTDLIAIRDDWLKNHKPATVVRRLAFLSHVFTVLRKDWGFPTLANPVQLVRRPTVDDARDRRLFTSIRLRGVDETECPKHELTWMLDATESPELPTILMLASQTGMRRSEIAYVRRENVDLRYGVIHVPDSKNGESRDVPLTPLAQEWLRRYLAGKSFRGRVFTMTPGAVTRAFIRAKNKARRNYEALCVKHGRRPQPEYFRDLRLHDLRHEGISILADVFAIHELMKISGHNSTRMLGRYFHPNGRDLAKKLAKSPLGRLQRARLASAATD